MSEAREWICPKHCGCRLAITAKWANSENPSHRHPIPGTIESIEIITVCSEHTGLEHAAVPMDPWVGRVGYIKRPIVDPTPGIRVYCHLGKYTGYRGGVDCGCVLQHCRDLTQRGRDVLPTLLHDPRNKRCSRHVNDHDFSAVLSEMAGR